MNFWLHCEHRFELIFKEHTRQDEKRRRRKKNDAKERKNDADFRMSHQSTLLPELQKFVQKLSNCKRLKPSLYKALPQIIPETYIFLLFKSGKTYLEFQPFAY